jgi:DNA-binding transcriptional LysR family regulator
LVPVVAPHFLRFAISRSITPEQMRGYVQCVIRDTARRPASRSYYLIEGAQSWTVSDQLMKRELILQGMGWGHMPRYLIEQHLRDRSLLAITGRYFKGGQADIVAAPPPKHLPRPDRQSPVALYRGTSAITQWRQ